MEVGPDRINPSDSYRTTKPDGSVKLRISKDDPIDSKSLISFATEQESFL
jgi:hypothetical protein